MACVSALLGLVISLYSGGTVIKALVSAVASGGLTALFVYRLFTLDERLHRPRGRDRA